MSERERAEWISLRIGADDLEEDEAGLPVYVASVEELAMALPCRASHDWGHLFKRLGEEIDFLVAIDGCNK